MSGVPLRGIEQHRPKGGEEVCRRESIKAGHPGPNNNLLPDPDMVQGALGAKAHVKSEYSAWNLGGSLSTRFPPAGVL